MRFRVPTPSARVGRVLRAFTLLSLAAIAILAVRLAFPGDDASPDAPRLGDDDLGVADAIGRAPVNPVIIRGYVFEGPGFRELRLCDRREGGDPPRCIGPFVSLYGINSGGFDLRSATSDEGRVLYSDDDVALLGTLSGTAFEVQNVVGGEG